MNLSPRHRFVQGFLVPQHLPAQLDRLRPYFADAAHEAVGGAFTDIGNSNDRFNYAAA